MVDLCRHIVNNQGQVADQHFEHQEDGQSYRFVICNSRVIFGADKTLQPAVSDVLVPGTYIREGVVEHVHALSTLTPVKVYTC